MARQYVQSPVGLLEIIADQRKLRSLRSVQERGEDFSNPVTERVEQQLEEYFSGKRKEFDIMALADGTPFQHEVWDAVSRIPYGKVATYGQLAEAIGNPAACRAVANAVGENPLLLLTPCHRVVAADGLGGFSAGTEAKALLLTLEGVEIPKKGGFSENYLFTFEEDCAII